MTESTLLKGSEMVASCRQPVDYPRRVLVTVAGMTPQIVTETLYALAVAQRPRFIPTRVVVLTTVEGARQAGLTLLGEEPGWFKRLCRDHDLSGIAFANDDIRILHDADGREMNDIRSAADNAAAADGIVEVIRELTADPDCALHVSMAGGRKTMGFFAAYALSLYGRPQDRLSHVLVSEGFENNRDFFYRTPYRHVIQGRDKQVLDAAEAEISLAEIPLVLLRNGIPEPLRSGSARLTEVVAAVQQRLDPPRLVIDLANATVTVGDAPLRLGRQNMAFYTWLARVSPQPHPVAKGVSAERALAAITREYNQLGQQNGLWEDKKIEGDERLRQLKSHTNKAIRKALSDHHAAAWLERFLVRSEGSHGATVYRLDLPEDAIRIIAA